MMKLQLLDNENNVISTEEFEMGKFDTLFAKYDWMDGLQTVKVTGDYQLYQPLTPQAEQVKKYIETEARRFVNAYMFKYYKAADSDLASYMEANPELVLEQKIPNLTDSSSTNKFHFEVEGSLEGTGIGYTTTKEDQ